MKRQRTWLIEDIAIDSRRQDLFDHHSVARRLAETARAATQSLAVGLLGPFGSGKSSVVRLLTTELATDAKWAVLHVSAEHHSGVARARALMYALVDAAQQKELINEDQARSHRACLEGSRQHTLPRPSPDSGRPGKASWRYLNAARVGLGWVAAMLATLWLIGVLAVSIAHAAGFGFGVPVWTWFAAHGTGSLTFVLVSGATIAAVLAAGKEGAVQTLKAYEITVTSPRPDSTDELEQAFARLLKDIKPRLVIAVDDIDRLAADDVLEALATVRSLLLTGHQHDAGQQPVFVLSCDESIVREAIIGVRPGLAHRPATGTERDGRTSTEEAAQEYLNKLFTIRLVLPAPRMADLRDYAAELLLGTTPAHPLAPQLGGEAEVHTLLEVLIHQAVSDPRHVIRLLNSFSTDYQLALSRESSTDQRPARIAQGEVTSHPIALARLTVLRHDFRDLYEAVRAEEDLLHLLDDALLGNGHEKDQALLKHFVRQDDERQLDLSAHPGLAYLAATAARARTQRPASIGPLLTLGSSPASRLLGSAMATEIRGELVSRDGSGFARRLADPHTRTRVMEAAAATLDEARPGQDLDNAVTAAVTGLGHVQHLLDSAPDTEERRTLRTLTDRIARHRPRMTLQPPAHILVPLLDLTDDAHLPRLYATLHKQPEDAYEARQWAAALLDLASGRHGEELCECLNGYFSFLQEAGDVDDLVFWTSDAQERGRQHWPVEAFGAILALGALQDRPDQLARAAEVTSGNPRIHRWSRPVALALLTCLTHESWASREAVRVLTGVSRLDEDWGTSSNTEDHETLAGQLVAAVAEVCSEDEDADTVLAILGLFTRWLPSVQDLEESDKIATAIAEAVGRAVSAHPEAVIEARRVLNALPAPAAAECANTAATGLPEAGTGPTAIALRDLLIDYLHRVGDPQVPQEEEAADACVAALTRNLTSLDAQGRFVREALPLVLTTTVGRFQASDLAATLIGAIVPGQPAIAEELLPSIHSLLQDEVLRAKHLPQLNQMIHQLISYGQAVPALTFAARYVSEPAIDVNVLRLYASHWMSLPAETHNDVCAAADREDLPAELHTLLVQHLVETEAAAPWEHADSLWSAATTEESIGLLAHARGRCPELGELAADAETDLLSAALTTSGAHLDSAVALLADARHLDEAIADYLQAGMTIEHFKDDLCATAVAASRTPQRLWAIVDEHLGEDQAAAARAAKLAGHLLTHHPQAAPDNVVQLLAQPLVEADEPLAKAIGHALAGAPHLAKKVDSSMKGRSALPHQKRRNAAFRAASGLK